MDITGSHSRESALGRDRTLVALALILGDSAVRQHPIRLGCLFRISTADLRMADRARKGALNLADPTYLASPPQPEDVPIQRSKQL